MDWAAVKDVAHAEAWTIERESVRKGVALGKDAARARAVAREEVRRVAVQSRGVGNVADPNLETSARNLIKIKNP